MAPSYLPPFTHDGHYVLTVCLADSCVLRRPAGDKLHGTIQLPGMSKFFISRIFCFLMAQIDSPPCALILGVPCRRGKRAGSRIPRFHISSLREGTLRYRELPYIAWRRRPFLCSIHVSTHVCLLCTASNGRREISLYSDVSQNADTDTYLQTPNPEYRSFIFRNGPL